MDAIIEYLMKNVPYALYIMTAVGTLDVLIGVVVMFTPSPKDDTWWKEFRAKSYIGTVLDYFKKYALISAKAAKDLVKKK